MNEQQRTKIHAGQSGTVRAAIIGMGNWGLNLVNNVQGKSDVIRFVAGATRTPARAEEFSRKHGIPIQPSFEAVLADPSIDAVVLATPHSMHTEQIVAAARAGKHVFTEKPSGLTTADSAAAVQACAEHKVTLAVGYNWRFQPALQEIARMLADGRLGKLLHIEGNFCGPSVYRFGRDHWRQDRDEGPGGGMTGRGVHVVDAMLYLAGAIDTRVRAELPAGAGFRHRRHHLDAVPFQGRRHRLSGHDHCFRRDLAHAGVRLQGLGGGGRRGAPHHLADEGLLPRSRELMVKRKPELMTFDTISTERAELEHFARAIQAGHALAVPGGDEVHNVAVLDAIVESARKGAPVSIPT